MNISGPSPIILAQSVPSAQVVAIIIDLVNAVVKVNYRGPKATELLSTSFPLTAALATTLQTAVQAAIEKAQGWAPGTSAVTIAAPALSAIVNPSPPPAPAPPAPAPTPAPAPAPTPAKAST